jgi:hypothetical protein
MPIQMNDSTGTPGTEVYLHSEVNPVTGMVNTRAAQSFMTWLNAGTAIWNTAGKICSMVGTYNGTHNASTSPTTGLQIGTQQDNNRAPNTGNSGNGIMVWTWGGTVLVSTSPTGQGVITPYNPPADTWFHVAYTCNAWNGTNQTHNLYVNGILAAQSTNALQNGGQLTQLYLNGYPQASPGGNETSNIQVDDVRFYSRQLSASEIITIYNSRGTVDAIVDSLVAYFVFEEGVPGDPLSLVFDVSGIVNNLIVQNNGGASMVYTQTGVTGINVRAPHI